MICNMKTFIDCFNSENLVEGCITKIYSLCKAYFREKWKRNIINEIKIT